MKQLLYVPDVLQAIDGSVGAPSIGFSADPDTGFYRTASGEIAFTSNGVQSLRFGAAGLITGISGGTASFTTLTVTINIDLLSQMISNSTVAEDQSVILRGGPNATGSGGYILVAGHSHGSWPGGIRVATSNAAGTADVEHMLMTGAVATAVITWSAAYHVGLKYGLAGTATGAFTIDGVTSGVVTVTVAAAAGTWTLTLPPDDGDSGEQLQTNGSGTTTWEAAASTRKKKIIYGLSDPQVALRRILDVPIYDWRYNTPYHTTGDVETLYRSPVAEEAPWAMHHGGRILNPINNFGDSALAIKALYQEITELRQQVAALQG